MNKNLTVGLTSLFLLFAVSHVAADVSTGFETSSGYTTNDSILGVHDAAAAGSNAWTAITASGFVAPTFLSSDAHPASGALSFQASRATASGAWGATLDLGTAAPTLNNFTIHFDLAVQGAGTTGNQFQIYFGPSNPTNSTGSAPYWLTLVFNNGALETRSAGAGGAGVVAVGLGNYIDYSPSGSYIGVDVAIDVTTMQYTSFVLTGATSGVQDKTSVVQASNGGYIPNKSLGTPGNNFSLVIGGNDIGNYYLDNLQIGAVPEAGTDMLLLLGSGVMILLTRRVRKA